MESEREQLQYGSTCKHGTSLGTPGGADFMCGYCESGFDYWILDPSFKLGLAFNPDHDGRVPLEPIGYSYRLSDIEGQERALNQLVAVVLVPELKQSFLHNCEFGAIQLDDGYWTTREDAPLGDWEDDYDTA